MASLAILRRQCLLSQRELARRAGVAPSTVYSIERGGKRPQLAVMRKIVAALKLDEPMQVDEFRQILGDGLEEWDGADLVVPDAVTDQVLADLWDNEEDAVYDQLAASIVITDGRS